MPLPELLRQLREIRPDQVAEFETVLAQIALLRDPACIRELALFLDDAAEDCVMFSIIHTIEMFDDTVYITELVAITSALIARAPEWTSVLYTRAVNAAGARAELRKQAAFLSATQRSELANILRQMDARRPEMEPLVREIL